MANRSGYIGEVGRGVRTRVGALAACVLALVGALALPMPARAAQVDLGNLTRVDEGNTFEKTKYNILGGDFGLMANFGLVGFEQIELTTHTNSNLATPLLYGGTQGFGTNNASSPEASYVQKIGSPFSSVALGSGSVLAVGKDVTVGVADNGNAWSLDGQKAELKPSGSMQDALWQDGSAEFLDFDALKSEAVELNQEYAALEGNEGADVDITSDLNNRTITLHSGVARAHVNVTYEQLKGNKISVKGTERSHPQVLVINVDMAGTGSAQFPAIDVENVGGGEVTRWSKANVILNLWDSSAQDGLWTGTVSGQADAVKGSYLAPAATVVANKNVNGQIIANKIEIDAEFHRDSFDTATFFNVTKSLTGRDLKEGEFTFRLEAVDDAPMPAGAQDGVLEVGNGGVDVSDVDFGEIYYAQSGTYRYKISEVVPDDATATIDGNEVSWKEASDEQRAAGTWRKGGVTYDAQVIYEVTVEVSDPKAAAKITYAKVADGSSAPAEGAVFENSYGAEATLELDGRKVLSGRDFREGESFDFVIEPLDAGWGKGPLPSGVDERGTVTVTPGTGKSSHDFTFGTFTFGGVQPGSEVMYRYLITEREPAQESGLTFSDARYQLDVTLHDENGDGTLEVTHTLTRLTDDSGAKDGKPAADDVAAFTNTHVDDEVTVNLLARKGYTDASASKPLAGGMFSFTLTPWSGDGEGAFDNSSLQTEGRPMPAGVLDEDLNEDGSLTVRNDADGDVDFGKIVFKSEDLGDANKATFWYRLTEDVPDVAVNPGVDGGEKAFADATPSERAQAGWTYRGMTYDGAPRYVRFDVAWNTSVEPHDLTSTTTVYDHEGNELVVGAAGELATFENAFNPTPTEATFSANKRFVRSDGVDAVLGDRTFAFELTAQGATVGGKSLPASEVPMPGDQKGGTARASTAAAGESSTAIATFGSISYDQVGTYGYTITEVQSAHPGVSFSKATWAVTVTVSESTTEPGKLVSSVSYRELRDDAGGEAEGKPVRDVPTFTNTYAAEGSVTLSARKRVLLDGSELTANLPSYDFVLTGTDGAPLPADAEGYDAATNSITVTSDANGAITLPTISYDLADLVAGQQTRTFNYKLAEKAGSETNVAYDKSVATYTVTVTNDGMGNLGTSVTVAKDGEGAVDDDGVTAVFTNKISYEAVASGAFRATKSVRDIDGTHDPLKGGEFTFELRDETPDSDTKGEVVGTASNDASGVVSFDGLTFSKPGTYVYVASEKSGSLPGYGYDGTFYTLTFVVTPDPSTPGNLLVESSVEASDGAAAASLDDLAFENTYDEHEAYFSLGGVKRVDAAEGISDRIPADDEFSFKLVGKGGAPMPEGTDADTNSKTVRNEGSAFSFGQIEVADSLIPDGQDSVTFSYEISEVEGSDSTIGYDGRTYGVDVTVTRGQDGVLSVSKSVESGGAAVESGEVAFVNTYKPTAAEAAIAGSKALTGRDLVEGEFAFELVGNDAGSDKYGEVIDAASNGADGSFSFAPLTYDEPGTYHYLVREKVTGAGGVTYDARVYDAVVTVTEDAGSHKLVASVSYELDGKPADAASFENEYCPAPASVSLGAMKTLSGRELADGEFTFELVDAGGAVVGTAANDAAGSVAFELITFDEPGTYEYVVREQAGTAEGVTYDTREYYVTVSVTDDLQGHLVATVQTDATDGVMRFENVYTPTEEETPPDEDEPRKPEDDRPGRETPRDKKLPQTEDASVSRGVLLALAGTGVAFIAVSRLLVRRRH